MIKRTMTAEDLYRITFVGDPHLSPDGTRVAYTRRIIDEERQYRSHIYVYDLTERKERPWTQGQQSDRVPRWSPDGRYLAFLSKRSCVYQCWLLDTSGGEAEQVTFVEKGVSDYIWSPDGKGILFTSYVVNSNDASYVDSAETVMHKKPMVVERLRYKADETGFLEDGYRHLFYLDLSTRAIRQLTFGNAHHDLGSFSPDGKQIVYSKNLVDHYPFYTNLYTMELESGQEVQWTDRVGAVSRPTWSPDGRFVAYLGHEAEYKGATLTRLWLLDLKKGDNRCLTAHWDVHLGDAAISDMRSPQFGGSLQWESDSQSVLTLASVDGNTSLYRITCEGKVSAVADGQRQIYQFAYHPGMRRVVFAASDPLNPGDLYLHDVHTGKEEQITFANRSLLDELELSVPEPISFEGADGWKIHGWIMKPPGFQEGKKYPLILQIHGGPHMMYANSFFHEFQMLSARGFVLLYTNPRGSHGYGQAFVDACRGDYGGKDYEDLMRAVDYALTAYNFIDEERLGVTGGSYGGYMTNWIVTQTNRFRAAVTDRSISNWVSFWGVSDIGYYFAEWEVGGNVSDNPDKLWERSPLRHVSRVETPLLILHSERDFRCPIEQAEQLFVALKYHGKAPVRFVRFPDANHELSRNGDPRLRVERLRHISGWFEEYLLENRWAKEATTT